MNAQPAVAADFSVLSVPQRVSPLGPVNPGERVVTLDILRGISLLGILILNIYEFASPTSIFDVPVGLPKPAFTGWHATLDYVIFWLTWLFAEGKMRSLFSMLFGAGVVLLTERFEKDDRSSHAASIFYRRNLWLLIIGLCHGFLLNPGDILVDYALLAMLVLYFMRRMKARTLWLAGMVLWILVGTVGFFQGFGIAATLRADAELRAAKTAQSFATPAQRELLENVAKMEQAAPARMREDIQVHHLSYWNSKKDRIDGEIGFLLFKANGIFLSYLGSMLAGMGLYKSGFLSNLRPPHEYVLTMIAAYAIALPVTGLGLWQLQRAGFTQAAYARWLLLPYCVEVAGSTLGTVSMLLLLMRVRLFQTIFIPFAAVGRTAISNYILTSLICGWVFSWGPWKLYGELEYFQWYCVVAGVWFLNMAISMLWLRFFRFGPIEWLWRSLTYWRLQPMRARSTQSFSFERG